ncbi:MAG: hypothetical protein IPM53_09420 [Anaerolineaceae bacterium]|nr:hypothetical protein [Anaerolineaceae bacterium]
MMPEDSQKLVEKEVLRNQYIALAVMFNLFFASAVVAILIFGNDMVKILRIIFPMVGLLQLFIGVSSIKNKVSIMRPKGKREYSTGRQATIIGFLLILVFAIELLIVFSPILPFLIDSFP